MWRTVDILSVAFVVPAIYLALVHLVDWAPRTIKALRSQRPFRGTDWMIAGVTIAGIAFVLNSVFWGAHFLGVIMGWEKIVEITYRLGPLANIFSRNPPYMAAFGCFIIAAAGVLPHRKSVWKHFAIASALFVLALVTLEWAAP